MEIVVKNNQSLFDIAIMAAGSAEAAFDIALENNISVTDDLEVGQILRFGRKPVNRQTVEYYKINGIEPATALDSTIAIPEGIEFWAIEYDFVIS